MSTNYESLKQVPMISGCQGCVFNVSEDQCPIDETPTGNLCVKNNSIWVLDTGENESE